MTTSWSMSRVFTAGLPQCETPGRAVESSEWTVASSFGGRLSRRASARCELRGGGVSLWRRLLKDANGRNRRPLM